MTRLVSLRPALAACLIAGAVGAAGCGGERKDDLGPPVAQSTTSTQTRTQAPVETTPKAETAQPSAKKVKPKPKPKAATPKPAATAPKATPKPAAPKASKPAPLTCLKAAGLEEPAKRGAGLWGGAEPTTGADVLVDGPYDTAAEAKASVASLDGVQEAMKGGLYVVSATLTSKVEAAVREVAECLDGAAA